MCGQVKTEGKEFSYLNIWWLHPRQLHDALQFTVPVHALLDRIFIQTRWKERSGWVLSPFYRWESLSFQVTSSVTDFCQSSESWHRKMSSIFIPKDNSNKIQWINSRAYLCFNASVSPDITWHWCNFKWEIKLKEYKYNLIFIGSMVWKRLPMQHFYTLTPKTKIKVTMMKILLNLWFKQSRLHEYIYQRSNDPQSSKFWSLLH